MYEENTYPHLGKKTVICIQHNVLQGPNFAGLEGGSTNEPLHILNNVLEDARNRKKELWLLFQDMAKAFDSVSITGLNKALQRIKTPDSFIALMTNIFQDRKLSIITHYGPSEPFTAGDGIDQGEVMSPLLWRIFYEPLLMAVQEDTRHGYIMKIPSKVRLLSSKDQQKRIACLAYVDDTVWIA